MRSFADIWAGIKNIFLNFEWTFVLEVILLFLLVYFVIRILYDNNAGRFGFVYAVLLIVVGVFALLDVGFTKILYYVFVMALSLFFLLLFSMEIKRSIWKGSRQKETTAKTAQFPNKTKSVNTAAIVRADASITAIVKAVQTLSKNNTGALIVLANGNLPREIVESGVPLNAIISSQLIEGVFIPKAPLHDGAMIICGDKIQAAGCFLPLTQKDYPKDYGTRHRAGIGVTEVADVATIIVSEETGIVSTVKRGVIERYIDSENLKRFLKDYYWKEFNAGGKRS